MIISQRKICYKTDRPEARMAWPDETCIKCNMGRIKCDTAWEGHHYKEYDKAQPAVINAAWTKSEALNVLWIPFHATVKSHPFCRLTRPFT